MAIDSGSIQSSVRINLTALKKDALSVEAIYDNLNHAIEQSTDDMESAIKKVNSAQKQGAITQAEATAKIIKIKKTELTQLKETAALSGKVSGEQLVQIKKLETELAALTTVQDKNTSSVKTNTTASDSNASSLVKQAAAFAAVALAVKAAKAGIGVFVSTEQSLANVKAVTNATAAEFKALEAAALEAGETTRFTANQSADALFYLSSAGLDAAQSTAALGTTLELAGATGSDLAFTAQTLTATMSQYNIEAGDAARISNIFAAANSNSQATLEKLTGSLRQVGAVSGLMGISLEETVGSLELLYNAGYQGEAAGRALKSALADLGNESSLANTKLAAMGIAFEDINPATVGLTNAIGVLEEHNITAAESLDIFGKVAGPQLATLISEGKEEILSMTDAVTNTEEAARQYGVQNDTLSGSLDKLKSAGEGLAIALSSKLSPVIRAVADTITKLVNFVSKLPTILVGAGAGATTAAVGFIALSKALALVGVTLTGPVGIIAAAGAVVIGLVSLNKKLADGKDRTDELATVTSDLVAISNEYNSVTKTLAGNVSSLSKAQKAELETRKALLALNLEKKLAEYATEYAKVTEQVERETEALDKAKANQDAKLAYYDKLNTQEQRIVEQKEKLIALEAKVADGSATQKEIFYAATLKQALDSVANSENERIENRKRMVAGLNEEIVASENSVISAKTALAETTLAGQESINAFARAYNSGQISIEIYKTSNKALYDQIIAVASEMKTTEQTIKDTNDALDDDALGNSVKAWQEYLKAILGVDTKGTGADAANSFIEAFDRELEASKTLEEALNGNLEKWDPASLLETKASSIRGALQDLFAIDPESIDESFTTTNEAVQILVDSLKETEDQLEELADSDAAKELDSIAALTTKRIEALNSERDYALSIANETGEDTNAIYEAYENKKTSILEDAEAERSSVVADFINTDKSATDEMLDDLKENWQSYTSVVTGLIGSMISANSDLINAQADAEIEILEAKSEAAQAIIESDLETAIEASETQLATKLEALDILTEAEQAYADYSSEQTDAEIAALDTLTEAEQAYADYVANLAEEERLQDITDTEEEIANLIAVGDAESLAEAKSLQEELDSTAKKLELSNAAELAYTERIAAQTLAEEEAAATKQALEDAAELAYTERLAAQTQAEDKAAAEQLAIEEQAAADILAIEEQAEKDSAAIQYKADLAAWKASRATAIFTGLQAAISAYSAMAAIPVVGPALGIAAAAAVVTYSKTNVDAIDAAKPTQSFNTGGIVLQEPGKSSTGDQHQINVNPGEGVFTMDQQKEIYSLLKNNSNSGASPTIKIYFDGQELADSVGFYYNNGKSRLN